MTLSIAVLRQLRLIGQLPHGKEVARIAKAEHGKVVFDIGKEIVLE